MLKKILLYTLIISGSVIMILPFLWMLSTALKASRAVMIFPPQFLPRDISLENFRRVLQAFPVLKFFFNSLLVAILATAGHIIVSAMAAYAFSRFNFKGRDILFYVYLATIMVPQQVTLTPLFILMRLFGWTDTYQALILPGMFAAFGTFLMRQFFRGIPRALEESALMDGAGYFKIFFMIILPLSKPVIATLAILQFMASWNNFLWPLIITSDISKMTLPLGLASLEGRWYTDWNLLMAGTLLSVFPVIVVYMMAQKYIIQGLSHTGLKY